MSHFKIGDRVVAKHGHSAMSNNDFSAGEIGSLVDYSPWSFTWKIKFDGRPQGREEVSVTDKVLSTMFSPYHATGTIALPRSLNKWYEETRNFLKRGW